MLRAGALELDRRRVSVALGGTALRLTRSEFLLLAALLARPGEAVSSTELARAARGERAARVGRPIDEHVHALRAKLRRAAAAAGVAPPAIETVRQFGYRLRP